MVPEEVLFVSVKVLKPKCCWEVSGRNCVQASPTVELPQYSCCVGIVFVTGGHLFQRLSSPVVRTCVCSLNLYRTCELGLWAESSLERCPSVTVSFRRSYTVMPTLVKATYMCTYVHTYTHTLHTYIHAYIHTYIHTYVRTYICTYIHTYIHAYTHTYIHAYNLLDLLVAV